MRIQNVRADSAVQPVAAVGGQIERQRGDGPVPVVNDVTAMLGRLALEHLRILNGGTCCIVLCAPDEIQGVSIDLAVAESAARFAHALRAYDGIFHYGTDTLLLCLPHIKSNDVSAVMARLRKQVCAKPFALPGGDKVGVSVTLGGAMMDRINLVEDTVALAEKAVRSGGAAGGNRVCMFSPQAD